MTCAGSLGSNGTENASSAATYTVAPTPPKPLERPAQLALPGTFPAPPDTAPSAYPSAQPKSASPKCS
jgi:hypothetical protein